MIEPAANCTRCACKSSQQENVARGLGDGRRINRGSRAGRSWGAGRRGAAASSTCGRGAVGEGRIAHGWTAGVVVGVFRRRRRSIVLRDHVIDSYGNRIDAIVQGVFVEWRRSLFGDDPGVRLIFGENTAGEIEVMKGLFAGHSRATGENEVCLWLGFGRNDEFALRVELGATFCGGDALNAASVGKFAAVGDVPAFAVS